MLNFGVKRSKVKTTVEYPMLETVLYGRKYTVQTRVFGSSSDPICLPPNTVANSDVMFFGTYISEIEHMSSTVQLTTK